MLTTDNDNESFEVPYKLCLLRTDKLKEKNSNILEI
jgi:hypothetical protein